MNNYSRLRTIVLQTGNTYRCRLLLLIQQPAIGIGVNTGLAPKASQAYKRIARAAGIALIKSKKSKFKSQNSKVLIVEVHIV